MFILISPWKNEPFLKIIYNFSFKELHFCIFYGKYFNQSVSHGTAVCLHSDECMNKMSVMTLTVIRLDSRYIKPLNLSDYPVGLVVATAERWVLGSISRSGKKWYWVFPFSEFLSSSPEFGRWWCDIPASQKGHKAVGPARNLSPVVSDCRSSGLWEWGKRDLCLRTRLGTIISPAYLASLY